MTRLPVHRPPCATCGGLGVWWCVGPASNPEPHPAICWDCPAFRCAFQEAWRAALSSASAERAS